jgi:hypothetical protein
VPPGYGCWLKRCVQAIACTRYMLGCCAYPFTTIITGEVIPVAMHCKWRPSLPEGAHASRRLVASRAALSIRGTGAADALHRWPTSAVGRRSQAGLQLLAHRSYVQGLTCSCWIWGSPCRLAASTIRPLFHGHGSTRIALAPGMATGTAEGYGSDTSMRRHCRRCSPSKCASCSWVLRHLAGCWPAC